MRVESSARDGTDGQVPLHPSSLNSIVLLSGTQPVQVLTPFLALAPLECKARNFRKSVTLDPMTNNAIPTPNEARAALEAQLPFIKDALTELIAFQSIHSVPELDEHNDGAADWVVRQFREVGVPVEAYPTSDGSKSVIGLREPEDGYPTVLLYSHFDVQPAGNMDAWTSDPWTLTERDGRWYGRGTADCKGSVSMHLGTLRALNELAEQYPVLKKVGIRVVVEGSEERGGYGLENLLAERPELFAADVFLIADSGNDSVGVPSLCTALRGSAAVTVRLQTLEQPLHSGQFGGAAPDATVELIKLLSTLHDEKGLVAVEGLAPSTTWEGVGPDEATFRRDAGVLDGVEVYGADQGLNPNDLTVARPAITVTAIDALPVKDAVNAVPAESAAVVSLRVPPGMEPKECQDLLVAHLEKHAPNAKMSIERESLAEPFSADLTGPALQRLAGALGDSYAAASGKEHMDIAEVASGGSIPLTNKLLSAHPGAELALYGLAEPQARIHSADESVDPTEIHSVGAAQLLFLARTAAEVN